MIVVVIFVIVLIIFNLRKREESEKSILMRILTNYLQIITAILSFNIKFPDAINDIFFPADKVGSSSAPFVSFDCFVTNEELSLFTPSSTILKAFLSGMLPFALFGATVIIWTILYFVAHKWCNSWKRNIVVTNIVILFLLHPNITRTFLTVFQCVDISDDEARVRIDLEME
jgi:hypothetical protein